MKKIILLLVLSVSVLCVNAQKVYTVDTDTVKGANTKNTKAIPSSVRGSIASQLLFTEVGGTSDGTAYFQGSVDGTTYVTLTETANMFHFWPNDTVTISDGGTMQVVVNDSPFGYYRYSLVGTSGDTTQYVLKNIPKNK